MFRFIHAADLHLDSPFKGLKETNSTVGNRLRRATFDAYTTLIDLCIERDVDCLVIAGDVFDAADKSLNGQLKFVDGLKRLEKHDIRVFICHGNHDPLDSWQAQLSLPKNVHRFTDKANYVREDAGGSNRYVVCGVSYPTQEVTDSLVGEFPKRDWSEFTIGLLHANVGGNSVHASYAPCTVEELTAVGYDYWALGHVHTRTILQDNTPWIGFPGNTQGRSRRETGARGVYVVDVGDDHRVNTEFVPVHAVRWEDRNVSIDGLETVSALDERLSMEVDAMRDAAGGCSVVYRIRLIGRGRVHRLLADPDSMQQLSDRQNEGVRGDREPFLWCTDIAKATASEIDLDGLRKGDDAVGDFLKLTKELGQESELAEQLAQELSPLFTSRIAKRHLQGLVTTPADTKALLKKAESTALDLLVTDDSDLT
jgi:exonuclease SbcD